MPRITNEASLNKVNIQLISDSFLLIVDDQTLLLIHAHVRRRAVEKSVYAIAFNVENCIKKKKIIVVKTILNTKI